MTTPPKPPPVFTLERQESGRLLLTDAGGQRHAGVVPVRAFPLGAPEAGLSLVGSDGREVAWIDRMADLPAAVATLLREELALRDFVPRIQRLLSVSSFGTPSVWTVQTDRGSTALLLRGEEDIRRLSGNALLIASGEGVQYRIDNVATLDKGSRQLLERFL